MRIGTGHRRASQPAAGPHARRKGAAGSVGRQHMTSPRAEPRAGALASRSLIPQRVSMRSIAIRRILIVLVLFAGGCNGVPRPVENPGAWRGPANSVVGQRVQDALQHARRSTARLGNDTVELMLVHAFLENRRLSNEDLLRISNVTVDQFEDSEEDREIILEAVPNARDLPAHHFAVDLLSALTTIDPEELSEHAPGLGVAGAVGTGLLFAPSYVRLQRSTALHDCTDYLRVAGIPSVNRAVWGTEGRLLSAIESFVFGVPY